METNIMGEHYANLFYFLLYFLFYVESIYIFLQDRFFVAAVSVKVVSSNQSFASASMFLRV